jgi:ABC-type transport system involved in multi-copper enzyme maturation permease subunit
MPDTFRRILALARLIILDGLRRHALIGLLALSLAGVAGGLSFFEFIPRDIGRASSDFVLSIAWVAGFIFLFFHAVQVIAWDEERRVIYAIISRPISRAEYVFGIFAGLAFLLLLLNAILGGFGYGTLLIIKNVAGPPYFSHLSPGAYLLTWLGLFAMELMILAVILLFSGLVRGNFPILLISLSFYAICSGLPVVRQSVSQKVAMPGELTSLNTILQWMTAAFPDFDRLDFKNYIVLAEDFPSLHLLTTGFALALAYTAIFLWLAAAAYQHRDLQ